MKKILPFTSILIAGLCIEPGLSLAQQALKTDPAGNPVTTLNLGGEHITGTLAPARMPAGIFVPVVQTVTATAGSVTLTAGTNVVVLAAPLSDGLSIVLPTAGSYPAGRTLAVVDPGGYSSAVFPVSAVPAAGETLNADTAALPILAGAGSVSLYPNGATGWSVGQSYLRAAGTDGLRIGGPANGDSGLLLTLQNSDGTDVFSVRGDGSIAALKLNLDGTLDCDDGNIDTDGDGGLTVETLAAAASVAAPIFVLAGIPGPRSAPIAPGQVQLYYDTDERVHVRTTDGATHTLVWTTP